MPPASIAASVSLIDSLVPSGPPAKASERCGRETLDGERPGDPDLLLVLVGLVVEHLEVGVPLDRGVDLLAGHAFLDVGVVRDRLQRDVLDALVDEPLPDVIGELWRGSGLRRERLLLGLALSESASRYRETSRP